MSVVIGRQISDLVGRSADVSSQASASVDEALDNQRRAADAKRVITMIAVASVVLFTCSTVRHYLVRSGAFDLGFFDQAVYLISQGQTPISSLREFHVLADHASVILYPLAVLYWVWPDLHMLLAAQAVALAAGAWPVWRLATHAGLRRTQALAVAASYLMFPIVLTSNIFDFHPDVFAVPALLMAVLAAREDKRVAFCLWVAVVLACKEVMALTVGAMGLWLLIFERRRFYGVVALAAGACWFVFAIKVLIPYFGDGRNASGVNYYGYLGSSVGEIIVNLVTRPHVALQFVATKSSAVYLVILFVPLAWALHWRTIAPLIAVGPIIALNLLSDYAGLRSPFYQYSLPVVPFLFISAIAALAAGCAWIQRSRLIVGWAVMLLVAGFAARLAKPRGGEAFDWETLRHTREAVKRVRPGSGDVLTTFETVAQLSKRPVVQYIGGVVDLKPTREFEYVLLNTKHSSLSGEAQQKRLATVLEEVAASGQFTLEYSAPDVVLYKRTGASAEN